jgi:hypothetical protein
MKHSIICLKKKLLNNLNRLIIPILKKSLWYKTYWSW